MVAKSVQTDARLTVTINNSSLVELTDLTASFLAIADEFGRFVGRKVPEAAAADVRLYISEIRSGSIVAEILAVSPQLLQGISYASAVIDFAKHLRDGFDFLTGRTDTNPDLDRPSCENFGNIAGPIAKDSGSQLNVSAPNGSVYLTVNFTEANAAQNTARRLIASEREPSARLHEKVVLYWFQARADIFSPAGDRGIIESIYPKPVKVTCANDRIKSQMVLNEENPFKEAFVVDVVVETINGKPALYKVLAIYDRIDRDDLS